MLARLKNHDLLDMMYLDEDALEWAKATGEGEDEEGKIIHKDSNGNILQDGDSVVLIKDLDVKGAILRPNVVRRFTTLNWFGTMPSKSKAA